jgi:dTDP-4-dehydrorhamnose reductase
MGPVGHNFTLTMLPLHRERDAIGVVPDQVGGSTPHTLAAACWQVMQRGSAGDSRPAGWCIGVMPAPPAGLMWRWRWAR